MTSTPSVTYLDQTLIPSLANDISIFILARVPRSDHPSLSLVSKAFRSLLSSPHFFTVRSLVNTTETSLFITIRAQVAPFTYHLHTLHRGRLVSLPPIPSRNAYSTYVPLGPCIYVLGGFYCSEGYSSDVWIFDCRFNKWAQGPSMHVARFSPIAGVVDGKLYVIGGCKSRNSLVEVYDPDMGTWEEVVSSVETRKEIKMYCYASTVWGRKIYATTWGGVVAYDVATRDWEYVRWRWDAPVRNSCCMINGVLYFYYHCDARIIGVDLEEGHCQEVQGGVKDHLWDVNDGLLVVNEGNLVIFTARRKKSSEEWEVRLMEVDMKKEENGELRGDVSLDKSVLSFPSRFTLTNCSAVSL